MPSPVIFVHAHPDDEALLTGGTIALLAASGRRVVLVTATDGAAGLASSALTGEGSLATVRRGELDDAARALGVSRIVRMGYQDSGLDGRGQGKGSKPFAGMPVGQIAGRLAQILADEGALAVVGYDPSGGYGHPDHVQVHRVVREAAARARTPVLLEATRPREPMARAVSVARRLRWLVPQLGGLDPDEWRHAYTPKREISSRVDVRGYLPQKRAALAAHASQATADEGMRTIQVLLRLPRPLSRRILGYEFFVRVWARWNAGGDEDRLLEKIAGVR